MKYIRILLLSLFVMPFAARAASSEFMVAAQLLAAAKNADIQQVQALINNGANVNFVDSTGMSIVCTALMNNDVRAAQILQMYGADASNCDRQIRKYKSKNTTTGSGGLFGGLSSAQSITLAAAGAAVVVGGLLLLTDVFDPGNDNKSSSSGGNRVEDNTGGNTGGGATAAFTTPYGPAMPTAADETAKLAERLDYYSPTTSGILKDNFALMNAYKQNYLLMMGGYTALARGYMGMRTLRNLSTRTPILISGNNLGSEPVMGGRPVNVALVTTNGINAINDSSLGDRILPWTTTNNNGTTANPAAIDMISSKYYNNKLVAGSDSTSLAGYTTTEDSTLIDVVDLSGFGTAINNPTATSNDNLVAKIVGGKDTGYTTADFIGFMPNGQMTIFRTGGGQKMKNVTGATATGTYTMAGTAFATGDTLTLFGKTLTVTRTGNVIVATDGTTTYNGYIGLDGLLYIDSAADGKINQAYTIADNKLTLGKELTAADYYNYKAMLNAAVLSRVGDAASGGRSMPNIIANASVILPLRGRNVESIDDLLSFSSSQYVAKFAEFVNKYYDVDTTDGTGGTNSLPGADAVSFFNGLGSTYSPLTMFSTGAFETDSAYSGTTLSATFDNSAPLVFANLNHLFMSVVAIGQVGAGTSMTKSVSGYTPANKYQISQWHDTASNKYYKARVCGVAGRGANGIDPWCFAATGVTDELATAAAAGAAGAVQSAFSYMDNKQLFALLALTADGPYLGSLDAGKSVTKAELISHLQNLYTMPNEYTYRWEKGGENYLDVFKEVFGYGLINVARATTPNTKVRYYDGSNIVSTKGNAYWRAATNATTFRASSAFSPRMTTISAPFFDKLESVDGEMSLPRIWKNEFTVGAQSRRGLYMGDVLGEFRTNNVAAPRTQVGNIGFSMTASPRAYNDNMGGLDTMRLDYAHGAWNFVTGYQHYQTDGASRFDGLTNPILALASNAVTTDMNYNSGKWSFGARAFSGAITSEELLENDPTISSQYAPAQLGLISGAQSHVAWHGNTFGVTTAFGNVRESDTFLGAQSGGLLNLGAGDTMYVDTELSYRPTDDITFKLRGTVARTTSDMTGGDFILGMSDVYSDAFGVGLDAGNFSFAVSRPLGVSRGTMRYAHADYDIINLDNGKYDIAISNAGVRDVNLTPEYRELRFSGAYRRALGTFTDGAVGFIYRVNPNNTNEFGNESIFMLKLNHRLGI